jgi:hypothetical protein
MTAAPALKSDAGELATRAQAGQALAAHKVIAAGTATSAWPSEDGGAQRTQAVAQASGLALQPGERLVCRSRATLLSTMTVLGPQGQVYLLTHSALRAHLSHG